MRIIRTPDAISEQAEHSGTQPGSQACPRGVSRPIRNVPILSKLEMSLFVVLFVRCLSGVCCVAVFVFAVTVGMRPEAQPCSLGRSGRTYSNGRPSRFPRGNPRLHVLIAPPPRVIFLCLFHHLGTNGWRKCLSSLWLWFQQLRTSYSLAAVVDLHGAIFPLAD